MSNKKKEGGREILSASANQELRHADGDSSNGVVQNDLPVKAGLIFYLKSHFWLVGIIGFLTLGALGAGLKYLDEDARREIVRRSNKQDKLNRQDDSFLNKINPFLPAAAPNPTPQLTKEYIYAGSRMLAIEDANAVTAPPADLAVWRPSSGVWWILGGTGSQQFAQGFGLAGDIPQPGDYDGDGKTDLCIFRPSTNTWWVLKSVDGNHYAVSFGISGDKPAAADYDGDGKTDLAVYRASTGTWYINQSSNFAMVQGTFGLSSDNPTPADYDGDGRADLAVWRGSNSTFYSLNSSDLQARIYTFAQSGSAPVPADYDGDGRADYAIRETNTANWIILKSSDNQIQAVNWQQSSDLPVQNDYDGDGKVDIAVWRNSNGTWYIRKSASGGALRQQQWGLPGDIPVPAFYRR